MQIAGAEMQRRAQVQAHVQSTHAGSLLGMVIAD